MAINTKAVKNRINTVKNTAKITKAMEMIAGVKMRKAVQAAMRSREYATEVENLLSALALSKLNHPLATGRKVDSFDDENELSSPEANRKTRLLIIITSDRGLCGPYNSRVLKTVDYLVKREAKQSEFNTKVVAIGRKAAQFARSVNLELEALYEKMDEAPEITAISPIAEDAMFKFTEGEVDQVDVVYTKYISGLTQEVKLETLLPISAENVELQNTKSDENHDDTDEFNDSENNSDDENSDVAIDTPEADREYKYEPGKKEILNYALPMLTQVRLYQYLLESIASEHSSRMIAMKNASESAKDLIGELNLEFNKARQAAITTEIAEISAGANVI